MKLLKLFSQNIPASTSEDSGRYAFRYFNTMYGIALFTVAVVSIASNVLVQYIISEQNNDSKIVNIAGRQRMLSQKIAKLTLIISTNRDKSNFDELKNTVEEWTSFHNALKSRDSQMGFHGENSDDVMKLFEQLSPSFLKIKEGAALVLEQQRNWNQAKLIEGKETILKYESEFLHGMDAIVFRYAEEAQARVERLKNIESFLLAVVLIVLTLEAVFIFNPVGKKIKRVIAELTQSEAKATKLANELKATNESLILSNKELHDTNYALDEATILIKTDQNGRILYANKLYCQITKYKLEELTSRKLFENKLGEEESIIYDHIRNPEKCKTLWQGEIYDHAKDYSFFWLDVTLIPIISMEGDLYQYLVICSDITKRKHTETELQRINDERLRKQQHEQKIRSLSIVTGQERERKRMAQEVHDGIGQMLTALKFGLESIHSEEEKEQEKIDGLKQILQDTIKETRRISSDLLPVVLRDYGLSPALRELTSMPQYRIPIEFNDKLRIERRLNKNIEISFYRICQEAINNAMKYSEASLIVVEVSNTLEHILMIIKDDGVGFDISSVEEQNQKRESGNGLNNMRERAALINCNLYLHSRPGKGTHIYVELPIESDIFVV